MKLNKHYSELNESYLFSTIAHKVAAYQKANPDKDIIRHYDVTGKECPKYFVDYENEWNLFKAQVKRQMSEK